MTAFNTRWQLDPAHTSATFSAKHMMVTIVRGTIRNITGWIDYDPAQPECAHVEATLPATEFHTGVPDRDAHLRSADFLDVENFPDMVFRSTRVIPKGEGLADITGDLTLRGITRPVTLHAEIIGMATPPWGGAPRIGFTATTTLNRESWGLTWNMGLEGGGYLVGKDIRIELDIEAEQVITADEQADPALTVA